MFEDKVKEMIKDEVAKAVSGLVTKKGLEKAVARAITKVFEPLCKSALKTDPYRHPTVTHPSR